MSGVTGGVMERGALRDLPALAHRWRFVGALAAWALLALASPGVLATNGSMLLAALGVGVWAHVEARGYKGRAWKGFLAHALGALPGAAATMLWIRYVYAPPLLYIGFGMGLYSAAGGVLLRRLLARLPGHAVPLAVALAWTAMETLRALVPMPFGLGWMRAGYHVHWLPLAGAARIGGVGGLTFVLAAAGGLMAALWRGRRAALRPATLAFGLLPFALAVALAALIRPTPSVEGPRVLLIQPGFPQARKQWDSPQKNLMALRELTRNAVRAERQAGAPEPDLVCWGESMLYTSVVLPGAAELAREGPGFEDGRSVPSRLDVSRLETIEDGLVRGELFGRGRRKPVEGAPLPEGASFLCGAEVYAPLAGEIRRFNGAVMYDAEGRRTGTAGKRYLVPGAETMYGLERIGVVEHFIREVSGYIPDFAASAETAVLPLTTRDGRSFAVAVTVCFDNAHLAPYTDPVRDAGPEGGVDFHVVVSNEAWYEESFEADQMVAFSRIAAIASGRALVRATNSGISLVMGPDGRELGRIRADGKDRMVQGHLGITVPVPAPGAGSPPITWLRPWLDGAWLLVPLALLLIRRQDRRNRAEATG